jgi:hypothetical protein
MKVKMIPEFVSLTHKERDGLIDFNNMIDSQDLCANIDCRDIHNCKSCPLNKVVETLNEAKNALSKIISTVKVEG